jgi:hypothetical protein
MRVLAAALTAIVASSPLSVKGADEWIFVDTTSDCKVYVLKHDLLDRFRNFSTKHEQSSNGKCPSFMIGKGSLWMADCEGFRMRTYWKDENKWGEWTTPSPFTNGESIVKKICN